MADDRPPENSKESSEPKPDAAGRQVSLPLSLLKAFPGINAAEVSVLIVGGLGKGIALSVGVDNGDGTATLLEKDIAPPNVVRMRFPVGASGPHTFAVTAISNDGHVKTGSLTVEPGLATVEDSLSFAIEQPVVMDDGSRLGFPVEIGFASGLSRMVGDINLQISGVPEGVHLTGGVPQGEGRWSLNDRDLFGLNMIVPDGQGPFQAVLTVAAKGQSGGLIEITRTALVGLAGRSVLSPDREPVPKPQVSELPAPPSKTRDAPTSNRSSEAASDPSPLPAKTPEGPVESPIPPAVKAASDWLTGHGVFTFASGHGGDLFDGGYGWFDRVPEPVDAERSNDDEDESSQPNTPGLQVRLLASGPVVDGPDPITW